MLPTLYAPQSCIAAALTALLCGAPAALAGKAVIDSRDGGSAVFEYEDNMLRIGAPDNPNSYVVMRDGVMYVVSNEGGQPMVFNASSMMKGMSQSATQMAPSSLTAEFVSLKDTGRDETIADMQGDVYELTIRDEDGREVTEEMVLSTDPRARDLRDAFFAMTAVAEDLGGEDAAQQGRDLMQRMDDMDVGVLRYGTEMQVRSIDGATVPAERFELPAAPMDMQGIGSMLGNLQQQQAPAQERGREERESIEDADDNGSDDAGDNPINNAFKKLFGKGG